MRTPRNEALGTCTPAEAGEQERESAASDCPGPRPSPGNSERTCILTRRTATRDELVRLVLGPDDQVHPDVRAKAPGRGAWIGVSRPELEKALAKGKLKGALARAFRTQNFAIAADLPERIEQALARSCLDRLGMEARSGTLINGADRVEQAARAGKVRLLLHAADAGADGRRRLDQAWRVGGSEEHGFRQGLETPATRTILSMALGRENVVHVALTDGQAAARVLGTLTRWRAFIVGTGLLGRGDPAAGQAQADDE